MVPRLRRFFDVRSGEGLRVLLSFLYIAVVVAAFLLAKPIRNSLFLQEYGPYSLVYVYAAVPLALSLFVPVYARVAARVGSRAVTVATLVFFSANVVLFWYAFRTYQQPESQAGTTAWLLPGVFYVWVNCFGVIAPVQAWSFANSLFDTRQARRLFGLVGAGASLGAIGAGLLARFLVGPVGGTVNMMLVLAALILLAAAIVTFATARIPRRSPARRGPPPRHPFSDSMRQIAASPYLRLMAALVFLVAIATQWTAFQLSLVADRRFGGDADALTVFFGTFNFALGAIGFLLQLLFAGPALRRFGVAVTILVLPASLGVGSLLILLVPGVWTVLLTNGLDQGIRFSLDKATYELLYLPLPPGLRAPIKNTIDIVVSRVADAVGAVLLGIATQGFFGVGGAGAGLRGTAAINLGFIGLWCAVAWRLRVEYVRTIRQTIRRHRIDTDRMPPGALDRSAASALGAALAAADVSEVRYALDLLESQRIEPSLLPALRKLLAHGEPDVRRRALLILAAARDPTVTAAAVEMLRDPDLSVRTEALLYVTREMGVDPLTQLEKLGDFEDSSIRAAMAAFLASPGPSQNLEAARVILEGMAWSRGKEGVPDRIQAARVLAVASEVFPDLLARLIADEETQVALHAIHAAAASTRDDLVEPLIGALSRPELTDEAARALALYRNAIVPELERRLGDDSTPVEIRRELPAVLVRIGTPLAQHVLIEGLLQADVTLRYRIVASLNKLQDVHPDLRVDREVVELLIAAEIAGHYRSYQVLGPLRARVAPDDPILEALGRSMEQELERIFRLMALLFRGSALHDAYVGLRSTSSAMRANALEFLDNVLQPDLRRVLVPLLDSQVTIEERIAIADRLVGAPVGTAEEAVATLLASGDAWLRSCAVYAVGALQLHGLAGEVRRFKAAPDPALRQGVEAALERLSSEPDPAQHRPVPAEVGMGVG
jgi:ATP:ADP antiporter, AAA family